MARKPVKQSNRKVSTVDQAVKIYGGADKLARSFCISTDREGVEAWFHAGVPRAHHLGLYVGLHKRGYEPTPKLFGLSSWRQLAGV
jgi:hypothetical protein